MKYTTSFAALTLVWSTLICAPAAQAASLPEVEDFTLEASASANKQAPILVLFMSSSCPYCEVALHDYLLPMQRDAEYDSKVILRQVALDSHDKLINFKGAPTTQHKFALANKIFAVPTVVLFDSQGKELTRLVGLMTMDFYLAYLDTAINESQAKIKTAAK